MAAMTTPPSTACRGFPRPPNRLAPPIIAVATTQIMIVPPSKLVVIVDEGEVDGEGPLQRVDGAVAFALDR